MCIVCLFVYLGWNLWVLTYAMVDTVYPYPLSLSFDCTAAYQVVYGLLLLLAEPTHLAMHVQYSIYQCPDKLGSYSPVKRDSPLRLNT